MKLSKIIKLLKSEDEGNILIACYLVKKRFRRYWIFNIYGYLFHRLIVEDYPDQIEVHQKVYLDSYIRIRQLVFYIYFIGKEYRIIKK